MQVAGKCYREISRALHLTRVLSKEDLTSFKDKFKKEPINLLVSPATYVERSLAAKVDGNTGTTPQVDGNTVMTPQVAVVSIVGPRMPITGLVEEVGRVPCLIPHVLSEFGQCYYLCGDKRSAWAFFGRLNGDPSACILHGRSIHVGGNRCYPLHYPIDTIITYPYSSLPKRIEYPEKASCLFIDAYAYHKPESGDTQPAWHRAKNDIVQKACEEFLYREHGGRLVIVVLNADAKDGWFVSQLLEWAERSPSAVQKVEATNLHIVVTEGVAWLREGGEWPTISDRMEATGHLAVRFNDEDYDGY
jgi:hypothetical protein